MEKFEQLINQIRSVISEKFKQLSADTIGWVAVMLILAATIPNFLAVMSGLTDRLPQVDILLMIWTGLALMFIKAVIQKDILNTVTIGIGFIIQAGMLALIFIR